MGKGRKKLRVAVLFGGRSSEHEVSVLSGFSVIQNLDRSRFDVIPIGIDRSGHWRWSGRPIGEIAEMKHLLNEASEVMLPPVQASELQRAGDQGDSPGHLDVVFPVIHGPLCEDGAMQGLLELTDLPYVGAGVLGSAIGMDKDVAKRLAREAGNPVAPFFSIRSLDEKKWKDRAAALGFPLFVKPVNMGSSVGVHKVREKDELEKAVVDAFRYDTKVLIEKGLDAREIELAVLEGEPGDLEVSVPGEVVPRSDFYSYDAKYVDQNGADLHIPANLSAEEVTTAQRLALDLFRTLECGGLARVDLFLDRGTGQFWFNEMNTLPGFTSISMYPKLWEASGIPYSELLSRLIDSAIARHEVRRKMLRQWTGAAPKP